VDYLEVWYGPTRVYQNGGPADGWLTPTVDLALFGLTVGAYYQVQIKWAFESGDNEHMMFYYLGENP
jgi:hypothetical protein